jgi:hypothetical protein
MPNLPGRKIPKRFAIKNPKEMTKWEKKRVGRQYGRIAAGKKPLAAPLLMSDTGIVERQITSLGGKIVKRSELVLFDGQREISVPLVVEGRSFRVFTGFGVAGFLLQDSSL